MKKIDDNNKNNTSEQLKKSNHDLIERIQANIKLSQESLKALRDKQNLRQKLLQEIKHKKSQSTTKRDKPQE